MNKAVEAWVKRTSVKDRGTAGSAVYEPGRPVGLAN